ncbi:MAG: hypothetical protein PHP62_01330 [Candidatus Moranbacteria bacterium]|nr:hypothetical protein [Candidatus Moranbacteria bacterium]
MIKTFDSVVLSLANWALTRRDKTMILISGGGAAGKSIFCEALSAKIGSKNLNRINADAYLIDSSARANALWRSDIDGKIVEGRLTACCKIATFLSGLNRDIRSVHAGYHVWTVEDFGSPSVLLDSNKRICIVEGVGACFSDISLFDASVFMYCDAEGEYERRLPRDKNIRGIQIEKIKADFDLRRAQFAVEVFPRRNLFSLVLRSAEDYSLLVEKDNLGITR